MGTEAAFEIVRAVLSADPISVDQAIAAVDSETAGAVVSFSGVVRNHDDEQIPVRLPRLRIDRRFVRCPVQDKAPAFRTAGHFIRRPVTPGDAELHLRQSKADRGDVIGYGHPVHGHKVVPVP